MTTPNPELSGIFERALATPREQRGDFLDAACAGDAALRQELVSLLEAHDSASDYFEKLAAKIGVSAYYPLAASAAAGSTDLLEELRQDLAATHRVEHELGGGGMSRVFLAVEIALDRRVVIKTLPPEMAATMNVERFRREIALSAQLQHPHIVPLIAASATGRLLYYTMPWVAGESLRDRLSAKKPLPVADALLIWRDVLDALAHAHAHGVVHRDIKPANILLSGRNAIVADFGIARAIQVAARVSQPTLTSPIGTPAYMAPEQAAGRVDVDHRADLYAAGLVMYEMLAGRGPFGPMSARDYLVAHASHPPAPLRRADAPARLLELVMQCLSKDPSDRPSGAEQILQTLDSLDGSRSRISRSRLAASSVAAALIAAAAFFAIRSPATTRQHTPPDSAVRLVQRALTEQRRRTLEGHIVAMSLLDQAIALDSGYSGAWAGVAKTAQFAQARGWTLPGRSADSLVSLAVRSSRRALELDSSSVDAWTVAGRVAILVDPASRSSAIHALNRAIQLDSNYAEAWFELGRANEEALQPREAERAYLRAVALSPGNTQALAFLGLHYLWYDDYRTGLRWADSAIAIDPNFFLARDAAAFLALALGDPGLATRHAEAEQRIRGHEPPVILSILAMAAAHAGDSRGARSHALKAERAIGSRPPSGHEAVYVATAWAAAGDTARALRLLASFREPTELHFQLHLKRDPELRWLARVRPALLAR